VDLEALADLCTPWCIRVVVTLRIAEHLDAGVTGLDDLAAAAGCDPGALDQVLGHLIGKGLFAQTGPGRFALNGAARGLLDQSFLALDGIGGRMANAWSTLPAYVRTGVPGYAEVFGRPFWEDLAAHPEVAASFDALMGPAGHGPADPDIPLSGGWDPVTTVVDVGGGTGSLLAAVLAAHPHLRGTLVDLPGTVARAPEVLAAAGVAERVTRRGQSFFDPLPPGADVYLLCKVLNDWPDRETVAILARCAEAARPDGRVLVLGGVSADDAPRGLEIETVLLGGRTSTLADFRGLAHQAGLDVSATGFQGSRRLVVECRPT
jgi:2,7-dihydroxy-5-methyl-1-naphthoate 7-O-methyltransferase